MLQSGPLPAAIDFNHGNATFAAGSVLTLDINDASHYDHLFNINQLVFKGTLDLVFAKGFTPFTGETFNLFQFAAFSGQLNAADIMVSGIDPGLLNFSNLAVNGQLQMAPAAVPLPAAVWLFGGGLAFWSLNRRRVQAKMQTA